MQIRVCFYVNYLTKVALITGAGRLGISSTGVGRLVDQFKSTLDTVSWPEIGKLTFPPSLYKHTLRRRGGGVSETKMPEAGQANNWLTSSSPQLYAFKIMIINTTTPLYIFGSSPTQVHNTRWIILWSSPTATDISWSRKVFSLFIEHPTPRSGSDRGGGFSRRRHVQRIRRVAGHSSFVQHLISDYSGSSGTPTIWFTNSVIN